MEVEKITTKSVQAHLNKIKENTFMSKNGNTVTVVILHTDCGVFTNFKYVWDTFPINVNELTPNDMLEIVYTEKMNASKKYSYRNFVNVRLIKEDAVEKERRNEFINEFIDGL